MGLVFLIGMAALLLFYKGRYWLLQRRDRPCVLPVSARILSVDTIKSKPNRDSELKVSLEVTNPSGATFRKQFQMVFEGDHGLSAGRTFQVYVDPDNYSHFVLVPSNRKQAVAG